jgi:hypothetical protein
MYSILRFMFPDSNFGPKADCPGSYRGFFQSLQANMQTVHCIKPRPFSSISLLIHYSLIIPSFDAISSGPLIVLLSKPQINKIVE